MSTTVVEPHSHGVPTLLTSGLRSYNPQDFPDVSIRQETWRFSPTDAVDQLITAAAQAAVTVEGPANVQVATVGAADAPATSYVPGDKLSASAWAAAGSCTVVTVPRAAHITEPVTITIDAQSPSVSRVYLQVEQESDATVVVRHSGVADLGSILLVHAGPAAHLTLTVVQEMAADASVAVYAHHELERDAVLRSHVVTSGSRFVRVVPTVDYRAPGADAELNGICVSGPGDHVEHRCLVDHVVPNCRSQVTYKNVLSGTEQASSHTVWIGDVIIHAAALGTDTYEMNRNLVLGDYARADSVPNLEIETGEIVGAGHASATGRLDDEQVFYLQSRGIERHEAQRLIVRGFFEDLLVKVPHEDVAELVRSRVEGLLG